VGFCFMCLEKRANFLQALGPTTISVLIGYEGVR